MNVCFHPVEWLVACCISPAANRKRGKEALTNGRRRLIGPTFAPDLNGRNSVEPAVNSIAASFSLSRLPLFLFQILLEGIFCAVSGASLAVGEISLTLEGLYCTKLVSDFRHFSGEHLNG